MMNWKCKEFKIKKYDNEEDYRNGKISSIESHHGNAITDNGLAAMWILATTSSDAERENNKLKINNEDVTVHPFKAFEKEVGTTGSVIAIGSGTATVSGKETSLNAEVALLKVDEITRSVPSPDQSETSSGIASIKFKATATQDVAAGAWNEWGIYDYYDSTNSSQKGILFNRKVESMGTKASTSIWVVEVTIELVRSSN